MTAQEVKKAAHEFGADLVGIADVARLSYLPPSENPLSIHSRAKSVIVLGRKVLRGALRGHEQGNEFDHSYLHYGFYDMEDNFLAKTTYDVTIWMERHGFEAVPLFAYEETGEPIGVPVAPDKPAPNVFLPWRIMAQAAGLGESGLNGLFLTPEYGPRQRFAMLVSDAALEADAPFKPYICNNCNACVTACPLGALDAATAKPGGMEGYQSKVAARDNSLCLRCKNGAIQTNEGRFKVVDRLAAACGRACVAALEERDALKEKFATPFKQGANWGRDYFGNPLSSTTRN